jgi:hypothetical protein
MIWADVLVVLTYVFMGAWAVSLWRLRRARSWSADDRDLTFSVATGVGAVITGVTALTLIAA